MDESPVALQRGSKLIPSVQLKCRQQDELKGKPMPSVKLCKVLYPAHGLNDAVVFCA